MKKLAGVALFAVAVGFAGAVPGWACACCAEPGERTLTATAFDDFHRRELESLTFARQAHLFTTVAGWDAIRGIANPDATEAYALAVKKDGTRWSLTFDDQQGNAGALELDLNDDYELFAVDPSPRPRGQIRLRKEWRFGALVAGSGMFEEGLAEGKSIARFVLHGKGNSCTDVAQFKYWTLDVEGPGANYRFYGRLRAPGS
ncbi:MAG: hypothetical protein ACR2OX_10880 [Methyloligellaceae bacterium]